MAYLRHLTLLVLLILIAGCSSGSDATSGDEAESAAASSDQQETPASEPETDETDEAQASGTTGNPGIPSQTAVVTVGAQTYTFALSGDEGHCSVGGLRGDSGVVGTGRSVDASGRPDPAGALVTMNIYPENFTPQGTQANAVSVDAPGDDADWVTAGPGIADEAEVPGLDNAIVHTWTYDDGWATGEATFVLESSIDDARYFDGELVTGAGSFEINCR